MLGADHHLVAAEDACADHAVAPDPQGEAARIVPGHGALLIFHGQDGHARGDHAHNGDLPRPGPGGQSALAALLPGGSQNALGLQGLQMVAHRSGGAQAHGLTDLPHRGGIAMLLDKFVDEIHDLLRLVAGSGHGEASL